MTGLVFDLRHGVRTRQMLRFWLPARQRDFAREHARRYAPVAERDFVELAAALPGDLSTYVFVDVGCGAGKALLLASRLGFRRVIGVELLPSLFRRARVNRDHYRGACSTARIEFVCGDALELPLPRDPLVLFLFDPFDGVAMRMFVARVGESLTTTPRELYVLYVTPTERAPWDEAMFVETVGEMRSGVVYRSGRGMTREISARPSASYP